MLKSVGLTKMLFVEGRVEATHHEFESGYIVGETAPTSYNAVQYRLTKIQFINLQKFSVSAVVRVDGKIELASVKAVVDVLLRSMFPVARNVIGVTWLLSNR